MVIVGVDEVGRGCWAGPLVAGAVILGEPLFGLRDSKKLSAKQRIKLATDIRNSAEAIGLGWVSPQEIDRIGLTAAVRMAMYRAVALISLPYDEIIIDGSYNFLAELPLARTVVKADDTVAAVSAASIVAKVARDLYMSGEAAAAYPAYGFDKHVGYGTQVHQEALRALGITPLHRLSVRPVRQFMLESDA